MKNIIIFDIDGTIADSTHRVNFLEEDPPNWDEFFNHCDKDEPIMWSIKLLKLIKGLNYKIYLVTGRTENIRDKTIDWLKIYNISFDKLLMRKIDDKRHDYEIKVELIKDFINDIWFVVEDKQSVVDKFREIGLNVLQCGVDPIPNIIKESNMKSNEIRKIANKIAGFEGYEYDENVELNIKIPSFTVKSKARVTKAKWTEGHGNIKQPVQIELDTFKNDIDDELSKVVPPAIAKAVEGKIVDKLSDKGYYIGSTTGGFPKSVHFDIR